ncbi:hypothetical protein DM01DRAFT_1371521 [Hesseltinella vesiculosa]|uniref:Uncharacterized protein n=1 Tax=Hesseltinella vesiculosa TaxID=101127 RepID=A0A1X2GRH1_9FUNG|nr:hypothetical protein DM01DRAFT_1371521 [Hesseltinella vesiculosa]
MIFKKANRKQKDQWGTENQRLALIQQYEQLFLQRQQRWARYQQAQWTQQFYQQKYRQAKKHWRQIRHSLHRETELLQRMIDQDHWVTADQHARIHENHQNWVSRLCHIREKLHEYQNKLLLLSQEIHTHVAHIVGMDRAFNHLQHEISQLTRLKEWTPQPPDTSQPTLTALSSDFTHTRHRLQPSIASLPSSLLDSQRSLAKIHPSTVLHATTLSDLDDQKKT